MMKLKKAKKKKKEEEEEEEEEEEAKDDKNAYETFISRSLISRIEVDIM